MLLLEGFEGEKSSDFLQELMGLAGVTLGKSVMFSTCSRGVFLRCQYDVKNTCIEQG